MLPGGLRRPSASPDNLGVTGTLAAFASAALLLALAAINWPFAGDAGPVLPAEVVAFAGAGAAALFTAIVVTIAWTLRDRTPAVIALGCFSMALGMLVRVVADPIGFGLASSTASHLVPLVGMIAGGFWFGLAALSAQPETNHRLPSSRAILVAGTVFVAAICLAPVVNPGLMPGATALQLAAGVAGAGYLAACYAFARAWRLLRLPSQAAMTIGAAGFAFGTIAMAGGGLPGVQIWAFESMMLGFGALPAAGFLIEHRARPGLRAMVLGLVLPGAVTSMNRGYPAAMHGLLAAVEDHDPELLGHVSRVAALAVRIGMRMRLNASHLREVALAAQLHDIGKIAVPQAIMLKPGRLTPAEFELMKKHTTYGEQIVRRMPGLSLACRGVGEHHERWDGAGYPYAREGQAISLTARIVAVADVYDALVSKRSYKDGWAPADALAEIVRGAGSHFDPRVVEELVHLQGATDRVVRSAAA